MEQRKDGTADGTAISKYIGRDRRWDSNSQDDGTADGTTVLTNIIWNMDRSVGGGQSNGWSIGVLRWFNNVRDGGNSPNDPLLLISNNLRVKFSILVYMSDINIMLETQTMSHIVESCPLTKLNGGLSRLHSADEDAVSWLTSYG